MITGANGFIGLALTEEMTSIGLPVKTIIRNKVSKTLLESFTKDVFCGSIEEYLETETALSGVASVVHLAARVHKMNETEMAALSEARKTNRDLTIKLARSSLASGVKKFIFISTVKVMGETLRSEVGGRRSEEGKTKVRSEVGDENGNYEGKGKKEDLKDFGDSGVFTENDACQPDDAYGISKWEAEQELCELFAGQSNAQCIILRLPMVYGPGNKGNMLAFLKAASKKVPLPLRAVRGKRSMIYVMSLCDAILKIIKDETLNRPVLQTYFINDGVDMTSGDLYSLIYQACNNKDGIFSMPEGLFRIGGKIGSFFEKLCRKKLPLNEGVISRLFDEYRFSSKAFCKDYNWKPPYTPVEGD